MLAPPYHVSLEPRVPNIESRASNLNPGACRANCSTCIVPHPDAPVVTREAAMRYPSPSPTYRSSLIQYRNVAQSCRVFFPSDGCIVLLGTTFAPRVGGTAWMATSGRPFCDIPEKSILPSKRVPALCVPISADSNETYDSRAFMPLWLGCLETSESTGRSFSACFHWFTTSHNTSFLVQLHDCPTGSGCCLLMARQASHDSDDELGFVSQWYSWNIKQRGVPDNVKGADWSAVESKFPAARELPWHLGYI